MHDASPDAEHLPPPRPTARLDVRHVSKTFDGRTVLTDVNLTAQPGEMHGIIGQNGSGKSTLAKVLSGYHNPDPGAEVYVDGHEMRLPIRPRDLQSAYVSFVHQDLGLVDDLSATENIRIAVMTGSQFSRRISWRTETEAAFAALTRLGYRRSPGAIVGDLPPADRARVAIARALQNHATGRGLMIFDESTRALPADALDQFYEAIHGLLAEGTSVLMIGHRLGEILAHCDRVTILRDGHQVAAGIPTEGLSESDLATRMLGHELHHISFKKSETRPEVRGGVTVRNLRGDGIEGSIDFTVRPGEVLGLTGLPGSAFEAVPYLLGGIQPAEGELDVGRTKLDLGKMSIAKAIRAGVVVVPENRARDGLGLDHNVRENVSLPWLGERSSRWWLGRRWQEDEARKVIETLGVVPRNSNQIVRRLSGGNAQKVLLGKWLVSSPRLLVLHEPTQGVDVQARVDLLTAVRKVADQGGAVLLASTEPEDLVTICDRVVLFSRTGIGGELTYPFTPQDIVNSIYSTDAKRSGTPASTETTGGDA